MFYGNTGCQAKIERWRCHNSIIYNSNKIFSFLFNRLDHSFSSSSISLLYPSESWTETVSSRRCRALTGQDHFTKLEQGLHFIWKGRETCSFYFRAVLLAACDRNSELYYWLRSFSQMSVHFLTLNTVSGARSLYYPQSCDEDVGRERNMVRDTPSWAQGPMSKALSCIRLS